MAALFDEKTLYDWLTDAHSVRKSVDQRASILKKEKGSGRRKNGQVAGGNNVSIEAEQCLRQLLKVSNRRYCRWVNDRLLRDLAPPLDADEIGGLFAPPPWGPRNVLTPLERITGAGDSSFGDMQAWEPFRNNVDMDKQASMIDSMKKNTLKKTRTVSKTDDLLVTKISAFKAWKKVDRRAREALCRNLESPIIKDFEERIIEFKKSVDNSQSLMLEIPDPFHRLFLHGICEFYGLSSNTISKMEKSENGFVLVTKTIIKKRKQTWDIEESFSIVDFMRTRKGGLNKIEAAA